MENITMQQFADERGATYKSKHDFDAGAYIGHFQILSLSTEGAEYDHAVPVYDHPVMGMWVAGHWNYQTESKPPRPSVAHQRTPKGEADCPEEWIKWRLDLRGVTVQGKRPANGHKALGRIQAATCNPDTSLSDAIVEQLKNYDISVSAHPALLAATECRPSSRRIIRTPRPSARPSATWSAN
jgi:hypothetical protein